MTQTPCTQPHLPQIPYRPIKGFEYRFNRFQPFQWGPDNWGVQKIDLFYNNSTFIYRNFDSISESLDQISTEITFHCGFEPTLSPSL